MKGSKFDASSIKRSIGWSNKKHCMMLSCVIWKMVLLLFWFYSALSRWTSLQMSGMWYFTTWLSTCFTRVDFSSEPVGIFFHTAHQVGWMSEPSHNNSLKLKSRGCHTATTWNCRLHGKSLVYVFTWEVTFVNPTTNFNSFNDKETRWTGENCTILVTKKLQWWQSCNPGTIITLFMNLFLIILSKPTLVGSSCRTENGS